MICKYSSAMFKAAKMAMSNAFLPAAFPASSTLPLDIPDNARYMLIPPNRLLLRSCPSILTSKRFFNGRPQGLF